MPNENPQLHESLGVFSLVKGATPWNRHCQYAFPSVCKYNTRLHLQAGKAAKKVISEKS